jgi:hypothetical protein
MRTLFFRKNILTLWLEWHFIDAPKEILKAWKNFLAFNLYFFSIFFLIKTFFSYWHKYRWSYGRGFSFSRYFEVFFSNLISRIVGALLRSFFITIGLIAEVLIFFSGLIFLIVWFVLPLASIIGVIAGLSLIYHAN